MGSRKYQARSISRPRSVPTVQKLERATGKQDHRVSKAAPTASLRRSARLQGIVKGIKPKGHHRQPPSSSSTASHKRPQSQKRKQLHLRDTCLDEQSPSDRSRVSPKSHEQVLEPPYNPVADCAETTIWRLSPRAHEQVLSPTYNPVVDWAETTFWRLSPKSHEQVLEPPYDPVAY
jgi:hypothetical protein